MQSTTQGMDQATPAEDSRLAKRLRNAMSLAIARWNTRRVVQGLSEAQLKDIGVDRAAVLSNGPAIEADVRLATYLASLR